MKQGNQLFLMLIFCFQALGNHCAVSPPSSQCRIMFSACMPQPHLTTGSCLYNSNFFCFCQALFSQTLTFPYVSLSPSNLLLTTAQLHSYLSCCCYYYNSFRMKENSAFRPSTWMLSFMIREVVWQLKGPAFHLQCGLDLWQCTPLRQT